MDLLCNMHFNIKNLTSLTVASPFLNLGCTTFTCAVPSFLVFGTLNVAIEVNYGQDVSSKL